MAAGIGRARIGKLRLAHLVVGGIAGLCIAAAAVSYPLAWHEVREGGLGHAIGCLGVHGDCPDFVPGPATRDSGMDHGGPLPLLLLVGALALVVTALLRPRAVAGLMCATGALVVTTAALAIGVLSTFLAHMFDNDRSLLPEAVFFLALALASLLAVALVVLQAVQYARARRRGAARMTASL